MYYSDRYTRSSDAEIERMKGEHLQKMKTSFKPRPQKNIDYRKRMEECAVRFTKVHEVLRQAELDEQARKHVEGV
jgi:hypothetical protein